MLLDTKPVVDLILNNLHVSYAEQLEPCVELFADKYGYHDYALELLIEQIPREDMEYLYRSLLVTWILKSNYPDIFHLGFTDDGEHLPIYVSEPFIHKHSRCSYKWWGMAAIPCNLILTRPNDVYISCARELYTYMNDTYDSVMSGLVSLRSPDAIEVYADSYRELKLLLDLREIGG